MIKKKYVGRIFFGIEAMVLLSLYCFGAKGITAIMKLKQEIMHKEHANGLLQEHIITLQTTVNHLRQNPFFQEKFAREQLHMAREYEEIFYL